MTETEFKKIIGRFIERPIPGRKLFIWHRYKEELFPLLPERLITEMDILELASSISSSYTDSHDDIQKELRKTVTKKLNELVSIVDGQQILVVSNTQLLARYKVPLSIFYSNYLMDRTIAILVIPRFRFEKTLPEYIKFNKEDVFKYFQNLLAEENKHNIIEGT